MPAWSAEVATLESLLDNSEADADESLDRAERSVETASVGMDDAALEAALLDAANKNRITQYGDAYVDDEMMNWARDLLSVGEDYGTIKCGRA